MFLAQGIVRLVEATEAEFCLSRAETFLARPGSRPLGSSQQLGGGWDRIGRESSGGGHLPLKPVPIQVAAQQETAMGLGAAAQNQVARIINLLLPYSLDRIAQFRNLTLHRGDLPNGGRLIVATAHGSIVGSSGIRSEIATGLTAADKSDRMKSSN